MLRTRIATAAVLAVIVLAALFAMPPMAGIALFGAIMLLGAWEWAGFVGWTRPVARLLYALSCAALAAVAWTSTAARADWQWLMAAAGLWWLLAFAWLALAPEATNRALTALAGFCTLVPTWIAFARLLELERPFKGAVFVLYLLLLVWAADIGAYFAGKRFGRLKLAPRVSPNKTWEGLFGGVGGALVVAVAGALVLRLPAVPFIALGLALVMASIVGDLTESLFKRHAGLKDSGTLLPGHGGVLDRIDSLTSSVPFFVLGLGWLGVLS
jgi:phosphatidate cytidylyltransferase